MKTRLVTVSCAILALAFAAAFVGKVRGPEGLVLDTQGRPQLTDHLSLWAAGRLAAEGRPAAAYDWPVHAAAMASAMGREQSGQLQFSYPPSFLLVMTPLASLPFAVSFVLLGLITLIPFAFVAARIVGRTEAGLWALATVPPFWNFCVGQTGALAAALLGGALLVLPSRPVLGGVLLGLLTFKPHLGLLVPVALLASGQLRAIAAAGATAAAIALASMAVHGPEPWIAFLASLTRFGVFAFADTNATAYKLQSAFGFLRALGIPVTAALVVQSVLALSLAALTWHVWRSRTAHDVKAGLLLTSAVLATPYAFHYDLVMLTAAMAFLLRHAMARQPAGSIDVPRQPLIVVAAVSALIMLFPHLNFPTGFLASLLLLGVLVHLHVQQLPAGPPFAILPRPVVG